jgi:hypothetical protein
MDFKVRVMEFISIFVQQRNKQKEEVKESNRSDTSLTLIKGLLHSLKVAHQDSHQVLFDRAKTVLSSMAKQGINTASNDSEDALKDQKILMTETMATLLKPNKDSALNKAYSDVFLLLTKHHYGKDGSDNPMRAFVISTYKELLKKFLEGRTNMKSGLSSKLF